MAQSLEGVGLKFLEQRIHDCDYRGLMGLFVASLFHTHHVANEACRHIAQQASGAHEGEAAVL